MNDETPYSKREQDNFHNEFMQRMDKQDAVLTEIKLEGKQTGEKVGFQNGRVRKLEDWSIESQKILETTLAKVNANNGKIMWIMGVGGAAVVLIGVIYALLLKDINKTIQIGIIQAQISQKKTENPDTSNITNSVNVHN